MQRIVFLPFILFVVFVSCKKDPKIQEPVPIIPEEPFLVIDSVAGNKSSVSVFEPAVNVKGQNSTATFTLDINEDGTADFELLNYYTSTLGISSSERSRIRTLNAEAFVRVDSFYYTTTNVYTAGSIVSTSNNIRDSLYAKVMKERDTLHLNGRFSQGSVFLSTFSSNGSQQILGSETFDNAWFNKERRYIGLKLKDKLCWIRISAQKAAGLTIFSYGKKK